MIELLPKKYRLEIEFFENWFRKSKKISFYYKEGTLRELLELKLLFSKPAEINDWIKDFLLKKCKHDSVFKEKHFNQLNSQQLNQIFEFILKTFGSNFFKKTEKNTYKVTAPSSSFTAFILENTNETLNSFLDLTWSQIDHLCEGIIWNANEQSKKGKQRNRQMMRMKELNENANIQEEQEALERIRKKTAKIKQFQNIKK